MNLNDFQNENSIIDPNLRRGTQRNSNYADPNVTRQKRIVTPQQMGFTHEQPKYERPETPILDRMDVAIARRNREAALMAEAIDEADGEGITKEEFQDLLVQNKDYIEGDDYIPTEQDIMNKVLPSRDRVTSTLPKENPTRDLMDELDAEMEEDEFEEVVDYTPFDEPEPNYTSSTELRYSDNKGLAPLPTIDNSMTEETHLIKEVDNSFMDFESGDINFDEENEKLEENVDEKKLAEKEQKEQLDKLKELVKQKIRPVSKVFDISSFSISKRPASNVISTPRDNGNKVADWVLMSSNKPIYMRRFSGTELERLQNGGKGRSRLNRALDTWKLIYDHIVDPHKPDTLENWAKSTSFLDIDHIYMAIYRANFEGTNFIPYNCTNKKCKEKVFLSDSFDIMDMCKFADKKDKARFNSILGSETSPVSELYSTEVVPVSDDYAFVFREPSIYNIIFESAVLEEEFVEKFGELISMCTYIDGIYYINKQTMELQPVTYNVYPNNMKKTIKAKIIKYSKIINTLDSDQYNTIIGYMHKINESGEALTYQLPEVNCPACKTLIPAVPQEAQALVFTRHQLATLATT